MATASKDLIKTVKGIVPSVIKPISAVLIPYLSEQMVSQYLNGKMTLSSLKNNEKIFEEMNAGVAVPCNFST